MSVIGWVVVLLPYEIGLLFMLFGVITFGQVLFFGTLFYALVFALVVFFKAPLAYYTWYAYRIKPLKNDRTFKVRSTRLYSLAPLSPPFTLNDTPMVLSACSRRWQIRAVDFWELFVTFSCNELHATGTVY